MIIKNSLDTSLFMNDDIVILPGKEHVLELSESDRLKLTCMYGVVQIWLSPTAYCGIEITCSGTCLGAFHKFLMDKNHTRHIEIFVRLISDGDIYFNTSIDRPMLDSSCSSTKKYEKPPLGCIPFDIIAGDRIHELSSAIDRYSSKSKDNTDLIRKWAKEIILQCDLIDHISE